MKPMSILALSAMFLGPVCANDTALELFTRRITPILKSPNASSCSECHLSGVDLKNYIGDSQEQTFAALREAGLIDVERPDESKLLKFIHRSPEKPTPVGKRARAEEYKAFQAWIRAAVKDPALIAASASDNQLGPTLPLEVIRHSRKGRVLTSFVENIWSEMGRCVNCHSPELNRKKIGRNGHTKEDVDAISWIVPRDPEATLQKLLDTGNIDLEAPNDSQVLTKPAGLVKHGGGPKFPVGSRTDQNFRRFLNDYAAIANGEYDEAEDLPEAAETVDVMSGQHLRIIDLPEGLDKKLLRADLHRVTGDRVSNTRWATAEGPINGEGNMWQSLVFGTADRGSERANTLKADTPIPAGPYVIRIYIDRDDLTKRDRDYKLGDKEFFGRVSIRGQWKPGYKEPKVVRAPQETTTDETN